MMIYIHLLTAIDNLLMCHGSIIHSETALSLREARLYSTTPLLLVKAHGSLGSLADAFWVILIAPECSGGSSVSTRVNRGVNSPKGST